MAHRAFLGVMFGFGLAACAAVACGNYVPPDVGTYGPPNGLANNKAPEPPSTGEDSGGGSSSGGGGGSDGGSSGGGGTNYLCQQSGGTIVDGGTCSVSFANDIYPNMQATGAWTCALTGSCHGGSQTPLLTTPGADAFYKSLANWPMADLGNIPYVNPCSTDPTKSAFACNIIGAGATGECGNPMPLGPTVSATDQQKIATWVACGAPNN